jgi:hypothetical protein
MAAQKVSCAVEQSVRAALQQPICQLPCAHVLCYDDRAAVEAAMAPAPRLCVHRALVEHADCATPGVLLALGTPAAAAVDRFQ